MLQGFNRSLRLPGWNLNVSQPSSGTCITRNSLCWVSRRCILCSLVFSLKLKELKISGTLSRILTSSLVLCLKNSSYQRLPKLWLFGVPSSEIGISTWVLLPCGLESASRPKKARNIGEITSFVSLFLGATILHSVLYNENKYFVYFAQLSCLPF